MTEPLVSIIHCKKCSHTYFVPDCRTLVLITSQHKIWVWSFMNIHCSSTAISISKYQILIGLWRKKVRWNHLGCNQHSRGSYRIVMESYRIASYIVMYVLLRGIFHIYNIGPSIVWLAVHIVLCHTLVYALLHGVCCMYCIAHSSYCIVLHVRSKCTDTILDRVVLSRIVSRFHSRGSCSDRTLIFPGSYPDFSRAVLYETYGTIRYFLRSDTYLWNWLSCFPYHGQSDPLPNFNRK
jgi:hypothetical protein